MEMTVNERKVHVEDGSNLEAVRRKFKPEADVLIVNGFPAEPDRILRKGDRVSLIRKGEIPTREELVSLMMARHTRGVHERLAGERVGIAGVGGLGSHVAMALARSGVGSLVIADMDVVEPSNLNRQLYDITQIGEPKVEAVEKVLKRANPFVEVEGIRVRLDSENAPEIFRKCRVVVEALDDAASKAELIESLLSSDENMMVVSGSGLAGFGPADDIRTRRVGRLFICGDMVSDAREGVGLMAPRVMVTAGHQANQVIRVLLGLDI